MFSVVVTLTWCRERMATQKILKPLVMHPSRWSLFNIMFIEILYCLLRRFTLPEVMFNANYKENKLRWPKNGVSSPRILYLLKNNLGMHQCCHLSNLNEPFKPNLVEQPLYP